MKFNAIILEDGGKDMHCTPNFPLSSQLNMKIKSIAKVVLFFEECAGCHKDHPFVYTLGSELPQSELLYTCPKTKKHYEMPRPRKIGIVDFPPRGSVIVRSIGY
jgi:hypothetical protein